MTRGAVAVDLGATSGRFAAGWIEDRRIVYEVVEQVPNKPIEKDGHVFWDVEALFDLCRRAWSYAEHQFDEATVGIDSWGVDHGFVQDPSEGEGLESLRSMAVAYRDLSHQAMFERMGAHRQRLYAITGIQHQPFNTIYQLACRAEEDPTLKAATWLLMPDLMGYLLTGVKHCEYTMASTTQLMGLDGEWCEEAFDLIGWPIPSLEISPPGMVLGRRGQVGLVSVGSHDTASAVFGLGPLQDDQAFLNVGTWSLLGMILDEPLLASPAFTNERTVDGRVRYLANIPGFYVVNRVHEELGVKESVGEWLRSAALQRRSDSSGAESPHAWVDLTSQEFFNPTSMCEALGRGSPPESSVGWAGLALGSLIETTSLQLTELSRLTKRHFKEIRVSGGGSRSEVFCQGLADRCAIPVVAGPEEATLLGNLGMQFVASGDVGSIAEASELIGRSFAVRRYEPA